MKLPASLHKVQTTLGTPPPPPVRLVCANPSPPNPCASSVPTPVPLAYTKPPRAPNSPKSATPPPPPHTHPPTLVRLHCSLRSLKRHA